DAFNFRREHVLETVLVRAGRIEDIATVLPCVPCEGVRLDEFENMPYVWTCVDVRNRVGNEITIGLSHHGGNVSASMRGVLTASRPQEPGCQRPRRGQ